MTNHVHLIVVPGNSTALAKALGRTHSDYARWLHIRRRESGHLWQNRFFSCPLETRVYLGSAGICGTKCVRA
jgi:putative transposase